MEVVDKELQSVKWTNESIVEVLLNSNKKESLKELLLIIRKYTNFVVIHYKMDLDSIAKVSVGKRIIKVA